jgi:hypothetical protein
MTHNHVDTWTTNLDECAWLDVNCGDNGRVMAAEGLAKLRAGFGPDGGCGTEYSFIEKKSSKCGPSRGPLFT